MRRYGGDPTRIGRSVDTSTARLRDRGRDAAAFAFPNDAPRFGWPIRLRAPPGSASSRTQLSPGCATASHVQDARDGDQQPDSGVAAGVRRVTARVSLAEEKMVSPLKESRLTRRARRGRSSHSAPSRTLTWRRSGCASFADGDSRQATSNDGCPTLLSTRRSWTRISGTSIRSGVAWPRTGRRCALARRGRYGSRFVGVVGNTPTDRLAEIDLLPVLYMPMSLAGGPEIPARPWWARTSRP